MSGIIKNDRAKGAKARGLILDEVIRIFEIPMDVITEEEKSLKKDLFLRMAPNSLPRLTEVTGEDGEPLKIEISEAIAKKNGIVFGTGIVTAMDLPGPQLTGSAIATSNTTNDTHP